MKVSLTVNGRIREVDVEPRKTLRAFVPVIRAMLLSVRWAM